MKVRKGFEFGKHFWFLTDGALDDLGFGCAPSIGDLGYVHGLFHCLPIFIDASLFLLCFASEGHYFWGEVACPRSHPAALGGGERPSGGGEAAPRGGSLGDCERQQWPGASTGRCDGLLMAFGYLSHYFLLSVGCSVC